MRPASSRRATRLRIGAENFRVGIAKGELDLNRGTATAPEAEIAVPDAPTLAAVLTGQLPLDQALATDAVQIEGSKQAAQRFLRLFPMPEPCECAGAEAALQQVA